MSGDVECTPKRPRIISDLEQSQQQQTPLSVPESEGGIVDPSLPTFAGASVAAPMTRRLISTPSSVLKVSAKLQLHVYHI